MTTTHHPNLPYAAWTRRALACVLALGLLGAILPGCGGKSSRTRDDGHGYVGERDNNPEEIPADDRRVIIERPSEPRNYRISTRDNPNTTDEPSRTTPPPPPVTEPAPSRPEGIRIYEVQPGDTLWKISDRFYGHSRHWRRIYSANRNRVSDPRELPVGIKLIIP